MKLVFVCLLGVAGCATDVVPPENQSLVYRQAFERGCDSGYGSYMPAGRSFSEDVLSRYQDIPSYNQGWIDGFDVCQARYLNSVDESDEDYGYAWEYY